MYTNYFGFREKPFTLTPNPRFIFLSKNHKEAFAHLLYGVNNHYGFIELIGEVGTGKTTVLRTLLEQLHDDSYKSALIFNPCMSGVDLLRTINQEFGIEHGKAFLNDLLAELNTFLLAENAKGKTVVLVIDEAQNLQSDVLEQIRLISNLETENDKLIQIILAGQPELELLLEKQELRQLNQRIAVKYKLRSMNYEETVTYIRHRMHVAGETGGVIFTATALRWIYIYTTGVPRLINILCDRILLIAYGNERRHVTFTLVFKAIAEIMTIRQKRKLCWVSMCLCMLIIVLSTATILSLQQPKIVMPTNNSHASKSTMQNSTTLTAAPVKSSPADNGNIVPYRREIEEMPLQHTNLTAINSVLGMWHKPLVTKLDAALTAPGIVSRICTKRNLRVLTFTGSLTQAISFNKPFIMQTRIQSSENGLYCMAVLSATAGTAIISVPLQASVVPIDALAKISNGVFYIIWQNNGKIPDMIKPGEKRFEVNSLQKLLKRAGLYQGRITGTYDSNTVAALRLFQQNNNIEQNNFIGEQTLAMLSRFDLPQTPSLSDR